jgi:hypothetical protein
MATKIYETDTLELVDGTELFLTPLKIKYLRQFMEKFENVKESRTDMEAIEHLVECALVTMKQYHPVIKTVEDLEDVVNMPGIYKILNAAAGININADDDEKPIKKQATESNTWDKFDLAKLEAELFLLGIWKDYDELESSLSLPELTATLESKRELDYSEKKFTAALQGVDLDKQSGKEDAWEAMKARVFSGGASSDPDDILSLQGYNAQKAGFGIGMGIDYERIE